MVMNNYFAPLINRKEVPTYAVQETCSYNYLIVTNRKPGSGWIPF